MIPSGRHFFICFHLLILFAQGFHPSQQRNNRAGIIIPSITSRSRRRAFSVALKETKHEDDPGAISANSVYFDIEVAGKPIGRLVFHLTNPSPLPLNTENLIQLAKGSRRGIDPKAHYVGCEFDYSPSSVEDGMGRYRWGHQLRGRGRNAVGRPDQLIVDPKNQFKHTHSCFGGQYYGDRYAEEDLSEDDPGVVLTVPVEGPGRGSSKFSIVRVGESPQEWRERLLINTGVIGKMDPSSLEVLYLMARQRMGPPTVVGAGVLEE
jgi:hypothetical protein